MDLRALLADLAEKLHLHRGAHEERARALGAEVDSALASDEPPHHLADRLEEDAVAFETDHPELSETIRHVIDALSAGGL